MKELFKINSEHLFGNFGGRFVAEALIAPLNKLEKAFNNFKNDEKIKSKLKNELKNFVGRKTPITYLENLSKYFNGPQIYLKREDLCHSGAHKINNALGQVYLAKFMGKKHIIAETGAGQHGVAVATACARAGMSCRIYMGKVDTERQRLNVYRMKLMGAEVIPVNSGFGTLKDAINEAMRDWIGSPEESYYLIGSALGPHPYPQIVRYFQSIIGTEAMIQILEMSGKLPRQVIACVGGGSNAIGIFSGFMDHGEVELIGIEAGGSGNKLGEHAARFKSGKPGVFQGAFSYVLQNDHGQITKTQSIAAGLDYASIGPEHANLRNIGRAKYYSVEDSIVLEAFKLLCEKEGILPALESAHALGYLIKYQSKISKLSKEEVILINLSGRGEKDLPQLLKEGKC